MKKLLNILGVILFIPTIMMLILAIMVAWINRLLGLPIYLYKYKSKGFKRYFNDNMYFTKDILSNIF